MITLLHSNNRTVALLNNGVFQEVTNENPVHQLLQLAKEFPEEILLWVHEDYHELINNSQLNSLYHHHRMMISYAVSHKDCFDQRLGYVDQSVFLNIKYETTYPTWLMSSDVGMILGKTLLQLSNAFPIQENFGFYLNMVSRKGQLYGLICYSEPRLLIDHKTPDDTSVEFLNDDHLFSFVRYLYKPHWLIVLFFCLAYYENRWCVLSLIKTIFKSQNNKSVDLSNIHVNSNRFHKYSKDVDVIIPTIGRKDYLLNVLKDLAVQSLLPNKVIIVEQNPDEVSVSELDYIYDKKWPFEIDHSFIHQTGACNARNLALSKTTSTWVKLGDDDNRMTKSVLSDLVHTALKYGVGSVTTKYVQPHETSNYNYTTQTSIFGSGNSLIHSCILKGSRFDMAYEFGYGEDSDFGMQIRNLGFDIIYDSQITITHLKAPMGGFRKPVVQEWHGEDVQPWPSPTLMVFGLKHKTQYQNRGYKLLNFTRKLIGSKPINVIGFYRNFNEQWKQSIYWAQKCEKKSS